MEEQIKGKQQEIMMWKKVRRKIIKTIQMQKKAGEKKLKKIVKVNQDWDVR